MADDLDRSTPSSSSRSPCRGSGRASPPRTTCRSPSCGCSAILRDREPAMLDLARHLALEKSSVTGLIDRAEARSFVERIPSDHDGRTDPRRPHEVRPNPRRARRTRRPPQRSGPSSAGCPPSSRSACRRCSARCADVPDRLTSPVRPNVTTVLAIVSGVGDALVLDRVTAAYDRDPVVRGVTGPPARRRIAGPDRAERGRQEHADQGDPRARPRRSPARIEVLGTTPQRARGQVAYVPQADALDPEFPVSVAAGRAHGPLPCDRLGAPARRRAPRAGDGRARRGRSGRPGPRPLRHCSRAVSANACCWPGPSPRRPGCCCSTSRSTASTPPPPTSLLACPRPAARRRRRRRDVAPTTCRWPTSPATTPACSTAGQVAFGPIVEALTADHLKATYGTSALLVDGRHAARPLSRRSLPVHDLLIEPLRAPFMRRAR